jgi:hypothetical protein
MVAKRASLAVNVIADATQAKAAFKEAEKAAGSLGTQATNLTKGLANAFATKVITDFAKSSINAASDLGESINAVQVTFGDAADGILEFGETASKTVGLSAQDFNTFAVQFAGFTKQIAGANGDVIAVTEDLTTRIADFASVMNLDIPQAAQVFQSSLAGETESIRRFGIDLSAAAVAAFAVEEGIAESASTMTEAEKVQARYALLMEETAKTAGDFANTSDSLANSQRILQADFKNMQAEIGQALLPVMQELVGIAKIAVDAFTALPEPLQKIITFTAVLGGGLATASRSLQGFGLAAKTANIAVGALGGVMLIAGLHASQAAEDAAKFQKELDGLTRATDDTIKAQFGATYAASLFAGEFGSAEEFVAKLAQTSIGTTERLRDLGLIQELLGLTTEEVNVIIDEQVAGFKQAEADAERTQNAIDGLTEAEIEAAEATRLHNEELKKQEDALNDVLNATLAQFNASIAYENQQFRTTDAIAEYVTAHLEAASGTLSAEEATRKIAEAQNAAASEALNQAAAVARVAEEQAKMRGETLTATESAALQIAELEKVAKTLSPTDPLRRELEAYIRQLGTIPKDVETELKVSVNAWLNSMNAGGGAGGGRVTFRAKGGPVSPTLGPYIVGEEGPEIFIPGQTGMVLPNTALIDAMATKPSSAVAANQPTVIVNVAGSVTSERDLIESIRRGLVNSQRNGSQLVYTNL